MVSRCVSRTSPSSQNPCSHTFLCGSAERQARHSPRRGAW
jgi:hypothetical protein